MTHFPISKAALFFTAFLGIAISLVSCKTDVPEVYEGTWVVTEATLPGITAMSQTEADSWLGKSFSYNTERAQLAQESCLAPTYKRETMDEETFQSAYRIRRDRLNFEQGDIIRIELQCNDNSLMPGQTLLMQEDVVTYLTWDGVFFMLEKSNNEAAPAVASI
ncbi:hypothetical protein [Alteromonas sp. H39]|uniref:hypothetical protein n=1 Tax=Alteromonas sp. H39 TaxID=3389876 RepID=UPI0039DF3255